MGEAVEGGAWGGRGGGSPAARLCCQPGAMHAFPTVMCSHVLSCHLEPCMHSLPSRVPGAGGIPEPEVKALLSRLATHKQLQKMVQESQV